MNVLIIGGENLQCEILSLLSAREGHSVHYAENGKDGVQMANNKDYQLMFINIKANGLSGVETVEMIRVQETRYNYIVDWIQQHYKEDDDDNGNYTN